MSGFIAVGYFLVSTLFSVLTFMLWARIALRYFRVSSLHPLSQMVLRFSNPLVQPITYIIRSSKTYNSRYDWACISVLVITELLKFSLMGFLAVSSMLPWLWIMIYAAADLIIQPCDIVFYAILIRVIMSWVNPHWQHPIADFLRLITEPILRIARRLVPDIMGLDFSPMLAMIVLKAITLFISASLPLRLV